MEGTKLKVLILSPECPPYCMGGIGRYVYEVSKELVRMCAVDILIVPTYQMEESAPNQSCDVSGKLDCGVSWRYLSTVGLWKALQRNSAVNGMRDILACSARVACKYFEEEKEPYDTIYVQEHSLIPLAYATMREGMARDLISICHLPLYAGFTYFDRSIKDDCHQALEASLMRLSRLVVVPSEFTKGVINKIYNIESSRIRVIPHGVNMTGAARLSAGEKHIRLGTIARYTEQKGLHYLIDLMKGLQDRNLPFRFRMIGSGPGKERFESMVRSSGLGSALIIMDRRQEKDMSDFYNSIDFYISTSLYETFGLAILESMACGCVPLAFDVSAIAEVLGEMAGELAVPVGDVNSLLSKLGNCWQSHQAFRDLSFKCQRRAGDFTWSSHVATLWGSICEGTAQ